MERYDAGLSCGGWGEACLLELTTPISLEVAPTHVERSHSYVWIWLFLPQSLQREPNGKTVSEQARNPRNVTAVLSGFERTGSIRYSVRTGNRKVFAI